LTVIRWLFHVPLSSAGNSRSTVADVIQVIISESANGTPITLPSQDMVLGLLLYNKEINRYRKVKEKEKLFTVQKK